MVPRSPQIMNSSELPNICLGSYLKGKIFAAVLKLRILKSLWIIQVGPKSRDECLIKANQKQYEEKGQLFWEFTVISQGTARIYMRQCDQIHRLISGSGLQDSDIVIFNKDTGQHLSDIKNDWVFLDKNWGKNFLLENVATTQPWLFHPHWKDQSIFKGETIKFPGTPGTDSCE